MGASEGSADLSHAASRRAAHPASRGVAGVGPAGRDAALLLVGRELAQRRRGGQPIRVWFSWPIAISLRKPPFLTIGFRGADATRGGRIMANLWRNCLVRVARSIGDVRFNL